MGGTEMRLAAIVLAALLAGCAHVDVGQVDYRVFDPATSDKLLQKYSVTGIPPLIAGDFYSVELEQAFVGPNISEGRYFGRNYGKHAEMAILANVFELDTTAGEGFVQVPDYDTKAEEGKPKLKLVYYGDNLERLQPFNFSNMPMLGRRQYNGGRIGLQVVIKEIDGESPAIASLLETLAGYGKTVSPVPQVTDVLLDLGTSLLKGSKDDRIFDYSFSLSSGAAILPNGALDPRAAFTPGHYILMKDEQRQKGIDWKGLRYDPNLGRLLNEDRTEFRKNLYLVLKVTKYPSTSSAEALDLTDWADFKAKLTTAAADRSIPLTTITRDFEVMVAAGRSARLKAEVLGQWMQVDRAIGFYVSRSLKDLEKNAKLAGCEPHKNMLLLERDLMKRRMSDGARGFLASYKAAIAQATDSTGNKLPPALNETDQESVISAIARTYMPWVSVKISSDTFADAAVFKATYVDSDKLSTLVEGAEDVANYKAPRAICPS